MAGGQSAARALGLNPQLMVPGALARRSATMLGGSGITVSCATRKGRTDCGGGGTNLLFAGVNDRTGDLRSIGIAVRSGRRNIDVAGKRLGLLRGESSTAGSARVAVAALGTETWASGCGVGRAVDGAGFVTENGEMETRDSLAVSPEVPMVSSRNFTFSVKAKEV